MPSEELPVEPPVWQNTLDGIYPCQVVRKSEGIGTLTIENGVGEVLLSEDVPLIFGAIFGPDVDDVATWMDRCTEFIDGRS